MCQHFPVLMLRESVFIAIVKVCGEKPCVDLHFLCASPLDRRDSLLLVKILILEKVESSLILFISFKGKQNKKEKFKEMTP